jgi:hypothetical protein
VGELLESVEGGQRANAVLRGLLFGEKLLQGGSHLPHSWCIRDLCDGGLLGGGLGLGFEKWRSFLGRAGVEVIRNGAEDGGVVGEALDVTELRAEGEDGHGNAGLQMLEVGEHLLAYERLVGKRGVEGIE